jgi:Immunoglobulin I-set domain
VSPQSVPVITQPPLSLVATVGGSASFGVAAAGSGTLSYQWQRNGADIAGATNATLTLTPVTAADNGAQFRVVVSNAQGSTTSASALLTVSTGSDDQQAQVLKLMMLWSDGLNAAGAPMQFIDDDFRAKAISEICSSGNATLTLDGAAAPAAGQSFPLGQHTLAAQFAGCNGDYGEGFDGRSSIAYSFADATHRVGSADATITNFVHSSTDMNGDPVSTRVNGTARVELDGSVNGDVDTIALRFIPTAGLSLTDVASGTVASFSSGNVRTLSVNVNTTTGLRPQLSRQEYTQLSFTRGSVSYVADGFVQFDFDAQGRLASGSGTVTITANGQLMARVSASSAGYAVEVISAPQAAPSRAIRRARIGAMTKG